MMADVHATQVPTTEEMENDAPLPEYTRTSTTPSNAQLSSPTYFTGLPTSAPPSFHSSHPLVEKDTFPHPTTTQNTQGTQAVNGGVGDGNGDDGLINAGVSVWAPSEIGAAGGLALEEAREDAIVRLMERVDILEGRLEMGLGSGEIVSVFSFPFSFCLFDAQMG